MKKKFLIIMAMVAILSLCVGAPAFAVEDTSTVTFTITEALTIQAIENIEFGNVAADSTNTVVKQGQSASDAFFYVDGYDNLKVTMTLNTSNVYLPNAWTYATSSENVASDQILLTYSATADQTPSDVAGINEVDLYNDSYPHTLIQENEQPLMPGNYGGTFTLTVGPRSSGGYQSGALTILWTVTAE